MCDNYTTIISLSLACVVVSVAHFELILIHMKARPKGPKLKHVCFTLQKLHIGDKDYVRRRIAHPEEKLRRRKAEVTMYP